MYDYIYLKKLTMITFISKNVTIVSKKKSYVKSQFALHTIISQKNFLCKDSFPNLRLFRYKGFPIQMLPI